MNAIEIRNLTKNFGEKQAVAGLDMTVPVGSIYGFIGENGSGKSTTEKIICGLMHQSSGEIKLFDKNQNTFAIICIVIYVVGFSVAENMSKSIGFIKFLFWAFYYWL